MKKILFVLAIATMLVSPMGCGACRNLFKGKKQTVAVAVPVCAPVAQCAPVAPCAPACGACNSGAPVTYGYDSAPMMAPMSEGSDSR